jgi:histidine triad (HIT) family protein
MSSDCIFCKIVAGQIPGDKVYHDDQVTAFRDIQPSAPTHILIVPNQHIASVNDLSAEDEILVGHLFTVARRIANAEGIAESGYRMIINTGPNAGQAVPHLHLHLLGGGPMRHPLG